MRNVLAGAAAGVAATVPMTMVMETLHERLTGEVPRPLPPREIAEGLAVKFGVHGDLSERDMQNLRLDNSYQLRKIREIREVASSSFITTGDPMFESIMNKADEVLEPKGNKR